MVVHVGSTAATTVVVKAAALEAAAAAVQVQKDILSHGRIVEEICITRPHAIISKTLARFFI